MASARSDNFFRRSSRNDKLLLLLGEFVFVFSSWLLSLPLYSASGKEDHHDEENGNVGGGAGNATSSVILGNPRKR